MKPSSVTRRDVLRGAIHLAVLAPAVALVACTSEPDCSDESKLTPAEAQARSDANYVGRGVDEAKHCSRCALFQAPPEEGACGGCSVVKGPISPRGTCKLFVPRS